MRLKGKNVGILVEDGFEDLEFWVTVMRLREEGALVRILGSDRTKTWTGKNGLKAKCTDSFAEGKAGDLDAIVIPAGGLICRAGDRSSLAYKGSRPDSEAGGRMDL